MLPLAMHTLFKNARLGLGLVVGEGYHIKTATDDMNQQKDQQSKVHWRTCVHALNIVRLIVLDAALGPDMNGYIPEATMLAVKGFR